MWCIHKKDLETFAELMHEKHQYAQIVKDYGDKVEVIFSPDALQVWVAAGYWYGSCD